MFHDIPDKILERMRFLEEIDARDRVDGTAHLDRLRQIPPETGKFIALMAASSPDGTLMEIGASAGYSALWLVLAAKHTARRLITFEILPAKVALARETFKTAGVEDIIELIEDDALKHIDRYGKIAFCFLDAEKDIYRKCYDQVVPNLLPGGFLIADNVLSHKDILQPVVDMAVNDSRVDALVAPVGKGLLICKKCG